MSNSFSKAKAKIRVKDPELPQEFLLQVGEHKESELSVVVFAFVVDTITECARKSMINEILFADDLILMSKSMKGLRKVLKMKRGD